MKRWRIGLLGVLISVLAIYFIVSQVDLTQLSEALQTARYVYVVPVFIILALGLYTRALRWRALLNGGLAPLKSFHILNVSYFVNGVLPLRLGEVARAYLASRAQPPVPLLRSASTIIVERLLDLLAVLVLLGLALAAAPLPDEYRITALVGLGAVLVGFAVLVVLANQRELVRRIVAKASAMIPFLARFNLQDWVDQFLDGLLLLTDLRLMAKAVWWTGISWALSVVAGYILMFAFFDSASWVSTCLYIAAASFVIAIPAVPGNIGTYEWAVMLALAATGYGSVTDPVVISFAVVLHAVNLGVYILLGGVGLVYEGITLGQLADGVQAMNRQLETDQGTRMKQ